jgi:hypothetical protein
VKAFCAFPIEQSGQESDLMRFFGPIERVLVIFFAKLAVLVVSCRLPQVRPAGATVSAEGWVQRSTVKHGNSGQCLNGGLNGGPGLSTPEGLFLSFCSRRWHTMTNRIFK